MRRTKRQERIVVGVIVALVTVLFVLPLALRSAGDRVAKGIQPFPDKPASVSAFETATLLYDIARVSPLFWRTLDDRRDNARYLLSSGFGYRIFYGYDGPEIADQHIEFLRSIQDDRSWKVSLVNNLAKYGRYEQALKAAEQTRDDPNCAEAATASALALGDIDALSRYAADIDWTATPYAFKAKVLFIARLDEQLEGWVAENEQDPEAPLFAAEISRRARRGSEAREGLRQILSTESPLESATIQVFALSLDSAASEEDFEFLHESLADNPYDAGMLCSWLALASAERARDNHEGAMVAVQGALDAADYCMKGYFMLYRLQSHWFRGCNPRLFDDAQGVLEQEMLTAAKTPAVSDEPVEDAATAVGDEGSSLEEQLASLYVYEAMTWLSLLDADEADKALDRADELTDDMLQIPYYRVIARQVLGDIEGAREIIAGEIATHHSGLAFHLEARVTLQAGDVEAAREAMKQRSIQKSRPDVPSSPFANHSMQEEARIIKTVLGIPLGTQDQWAGHDMPPEKMDGDVEARDWLSTFSGHSRHPRIEHQFLVPLMARWKGSKQEAGFWIGYHRYEGVSPLGALIKAHWQYLLAQSKSDAAGMEKFSSRMDAVREIFLTNDNWSLIDCEMGLY